MFKAVSNLKKIPEALGELRRSRLVLGTASFGMDYGATNAGGKVAKDEIRATLTMCRANGIGELDTAQAYGRAEEELGEAGVGDFSITTKVSVHPGEGAKSVTEKLMQSLRCLKVEQIENLLLHNEDCLGRDDAAPIAEELHRLVGKGLVRKVGLSFYEPKQALELCKKYGFQVIQLPANALDQRLLQDGLYDRFLENKIEVQIRSIFLQGILIDYPKNLQAVPQELIRLTEEFRAKCRERGLSPLQGALGWVCREFKQAKVVVGVTAVKELEQILESLPEEAGNFQFNSGDWSPDFDPRTWKN
jgi:aryl-alcohol dehydrogenase-like predicted oxidoreductase